MEIRPRGSGFGQGLSCLVHPGFTVKLWHPLAIPGLPCGCPGIAG